MSPFDTAYFATLKKKNLSPAISSQAKELTALTGDWFFQYGQQAAGDRQTVKRLEERITKLEQQLSRGDIA